MEAFLDILPLLVWIVIQFALLWGAVFFAFWLVGVPISDIWKVTAERFTRRLKPGPLRIVPWFYRQGRRFQVWLVLTLFVLAVAVADPSNRFAVIGGLSSFALILISSVTRSVFLITTNRSEKEKRSIL